MSAEKLVHVYIDPEDGSKAMKQICEAAGAGTWRIVATVSFGSRSFAKQVSPGINDPHRFGGEPVLVLLERDGKDFEDEADYSLFESVH